MRARRKAGAARRTIDSDGVVRTERSGSSLRPWAAAAALVLAALGWLFLDVRGERSERPIDTDRARPAMRSVPGAPASTDARPSLPGESAEAPPGPQEVYLDQLDPAELEPTGIHLFPRPGTKPIKGGILVPDGYQLPPGYVRHYQATDDGEPVRAILLFHPEHRPRDRSGRPVPMPPDRVVPPELAPPGMPLDMLEPPPVRADFDETSEPP